MSRVLGIPKWDEKRREWRLGVRNKGKRTTVTSKHKSQRKGQAECIQKALAWIESSSIPDNIRFMDAWNEYLEYYTNKFKITSAKQLESRAKAHLIPAFKAYRMKNITKRDWQGVVDRAYENGAKSHKTLRGIVATITPFCKWCAAKGYIRDSDVPIYFDYPTTELSRQKKILQPDQLRLLFSPEVDNDNFYIFCFRFLTVTGLRRGELCGLKTERDYDGETITIRESVSHEQYITDGKTAQARRTIQLTDIAKEQIKRHQERAPGGIYLFSNEHGQRISPRVISNNWRKFRALHGFDITLHELRHTFISYSRLRTTIDLEALKQLYGHSADMDTERTNVHSILKTPEEFAAEKLQKRAMAKQLNNVFQTVIDTQTDTQNG